MPRANREIADLCIEHAWREDIDDRSRWLLELAAKRIKRLGRRCVSLSHKLETVEGELGELLFDLEEIDKCLSKPTWRIHLNSLLYGVTVALFVTLQNVMDAVHVQLKRLRDNFASLIRTRTN